MKFLTGSRGSSSPLLLALSILFTFTVFILVIIATAGSSANYSPIRNVYLGKADISHINVTKVIPEIAPVLTVLGTAITAPNVTAEQVFDALRSIAETPALSPLLTLLINTTNVSSTVVALTELAPLATASNNSSSTTEQVHQIQGLLNLSTNTNTTLQGLKSLVVATLASTGTNSSSSAEELAFAILGDSENVTASTESLVTLNSLSYAEKQQLSPVFELIESSENQTATFGALQTLMNTTISSSVSSTLFSTLEKVTNASELVSTIETYSAVVPASLKPALEALEVLIEDSSNATETLNILSSLLEANITQSSSAKESFVALTTLLQYGSNDTLVLQSVETLSSMNTSSSTTAQLQALDQLFESSSNATLTLNYLVSLQSGLTSSAGLVEYVPYIFELISASSDPASTITALINLTVWASQNGSVFEPLLAILAQSTTIQSVTEDELTAMTPEILDYLRIPTAFRLSIFTLCHESLNGTTLDCSKSHAVQNLDFRGIIYEALHDSDFKPYLDSLGISADDLYLEGDLLQREHEYVPAIKATLALSILSIVCSFFLMIAFIYLMVRTFSKQSIWYVFLIYVLFTTIFTCLAAVIPTAISGIIKSGTSHDKYGVVYTNGSAYFGLMWTSFCLAIFVLCMTTLLWWQRRRSSLSRAAGDAPGEVYEESEDVAGDAALEKTKTTTTINEEDSSESASRGTSSNAENPEKVV